MNFNFKIFRTYTFFIFGLILITASCKYEPGSLPEDDNWLYEEIGITPTYENLSGRVKSVDEIYLTAKQEFGEIVKGERIKPNLLGDSFSEFYFNKKGYPIKQTVYGYLDNDSISLEQSFVYSNTGDMIEHKVYVNDSNLNSDIGERHSLHYDDKNNLEEINFFVINKMLNPATPVLTGNRCCD